MTAVIKKIMTVIFTAVLAIYPAVMIYNSASRDYRSHADTSGGISILDEYAERKADDAKISIESLKTSKQKNLSEEAKKQRIEASIKKIERGELTYRDVFRDVYVAGDSLVAGLGAFGIINPNHLMARVNAFLYDLRKNTVRIKNAKPEILILHYGINAVSEYDGYDRQFIDLYTELIEVIQKDSPDTRIIVSLFFSVDRAVAREKKFDYIDHYNDLLVQMCEKLGVEYLDSTDLLKEHNQYYKEDGVHLVKEFYTEHWAKHIMREMEIY